ncbi:MAG: DUF6340 family protein [Bacteroidota bacterium]|nr:DUF6340 family protein [Bacteroidota bacterium]
MRSTRNFLPLFLILFSLTSCLITNSALTVQVEIMKPGIIIIPADLNKVAVFKHDMAQTDSCFSMYSNHKVVSYSTIKYRDLSDICVDAFAKSIERDGYFQQINNYRDSLNYQWSGIASLTSTDELFNKTKSDVCIFLDYFNLDKSSIYSYQMLNTNAHLLWTIVLKGDTSSYIYHQVDTLTYEVPAFNPNSKKVIKSTLINASEYLGRSFGAKLIPSGVTVDRLYYQSYNPDMIIAERFALNGEWLKAAEIWNKETKNKNPRIAAKACYNMALACEMEGNPKVAIDWLVKSYSVLTKNNEEHKANCQRYINILAMRIIEIKKLEKQVTKQNSKSI